MAILAHRRLPAADTHPILLQAVWFVFGSLAAFLVPYVFADQLELRSDVFYGIYFLFVGALITSYAIDTGLDVGEVVRRNWKWSLLAAVPVSAFVVMNVLSEDATARPHGFYFAWTLGWRGVLYGMADALLLSAFPAMVAYSVLRKDLRGISRKAMFAALTMALTITITATYHLGYSQVRDNGMDRNGMLGPEIGNTVISLPTIATLNPIGSMIAHASMHITADGHSYETDLFLPPQQSAR